VRQVDVLIGGGGMVGLPLGLALAQGGLKTLVVDAAPPAKVLEPHFDGRVSALAYASVRMFKALGVWDALKAHAQPIHQILVTDGQAGKPASPGIVFQAPSGNWTSTYGEIGLMPACHAPYSDVALK